MHPALRKGPLFTKKHPAFSTFLQLPPFFTFCITKNTPIFHIFYLTPPFHFLPTGLRIYIPNGTGIGSSVFAGLAVVTNMDICSNRPHLALVRRCGPTNQILYTSDFAHRSASSSVTLRICVALYLATGNECGPQIIINNTKKLFV